jgi:hypothetical protein
MNFEAKSAEDIAKLGLWAKGEYDFEIVKAEDATSKSTGAQMIKLELMVYDNDGRTRRITDYLLASLAAKLRHFCDTCGLLPQYQSGTLCAADCEGRTGRCKVVIQEDKSGQYPPKNSIADYSIRRTKEIQPPASAAKVTDDMPEF